MDPEHDQPNDIPDETEGMAYAEEMYPEDLEMNELPGEDYSQRELVEKGETHSSLTSDHIRFGLSRVARTLDTFEFAYSRLDCKSKGINNIDTLARYIHLRMIDLGGNKLTSLKAIGSIQTLLYLNVEGNLVESLSEIPEFPFLQALILRNNKLRSSKGLFPNCLAYLQLGGNQIKEVLGMTSDVYPWLNILELEGNKLKSLKGIDLPLLQRIYLGRNELKSLKGLEGCPNLTHLHVRENRISHLDDFPASEKLEYVNLRDNNILRYTQMIFLGNAVNMKTLVLKGNPLSTLADYKIEVLAANPNLRRLDKEPVLETDMVEARRLRNGREQGQLPQVVDDEELIRNSASVLDLEEEGEGSDRPSRENVPWFTEGGEEGEEGDNIESANNA